MRRLADLLARDGGQKLGAIALAVGVWFVAFRRTTGTANFELRLRPLADGAASATPLDEVVVRVPRGFELRAPPGVTVRLRGSRADLASIPSVGALFDPLRGPEGPRGSFSAGRQFAKKGDLRWFPPRAVEFVERMEPEVIELDFERHETRDLPLGSSALAVSGAVAPGFVVRPDRARFSPPTVLLSGRADALAALGDATPFRLDPILLAGEESSVARIVRLHPDLAREGISMDPPSVFVTLPVEPRPTEVRFLGRIETVSFGPGADARTERLRLRPEDLEREFVLSFRGSPPLPHVDSESAASFVRLFVDLGEIPSAWLEGTEREIELPIRSVFRPVPGAATRSDLEVRDASGRSTAVVQRVAP